MTRIANFPFSPYVWLAAFICALYPINEYQLLFMGASVLLLLFWSYSRLSKALKTGMSIPRTWIIAVMGGLWAVSLISALHSEIPWISMMAFFLIGAMPMTFLTLALAPYDAREWKIVIAGVALIMGILGIWAMVQFIFFSEYFSGRAVHPLRDPNSFAALFNLALIIALGWMNSAGNQRDKIKAFILAIILTGGLIATGSRGGLLAAFLGLVMITILCWSGIKASKRWWLGFIIAAGLIIGVSPSLTIDHHTTVGRLAKTIGLQEGVVPGDRPDTMKAGWEMTKDHWLTGTGIGTFYLYYPQYRPAHQEDYVTHAHNDPLQFWAEMGIAAPVLFYTFLGMAIFLTYRAANRDDLIQSERDRILFPFISLGVLAAHSHINFNFYNLSILMAAGLVMAYWLSALHLPVREIARAGIKLKQAALAVAFALAILVHSCIIASEDFIYKARNALMANDIETYSVYLLLADELALHQNPTVYMTAVNVPMAVLVERQSSMSDEEIKTEVAHIDNNLNKALQLNPRVGGTWYFKGLLAYRVPKNLLPANYPTPEECFINALKLDPTHIAARVALVDMALTKKDYELAARWLRPALHMVLFTDQSQELYSRAMLVFNLLNDEDGLKKTQKAMYSYEQRSKYSGWRNENTPWRVMTGQTFPQEAESVTK